VPALSPEEVNMNVARSGSLQVAPGVGGLTVTGTAKDGRRRANAILALDQLKQGSDRGADLRRPTGVARPGCRVWDRPDTPLSDLIEQLNAANALTDPAAREAAVKAARSSAPPAPRRVFVGKDTDRAATVSLADASGRPRLRLRVEAGGDAAIEFLDEVSAVVDRVPPRR
jgi:hypothetical protein